ncbi:MAG: glycosyltransferase family 4 protein [Candidatus Omnitrophota bacterium]
MIKTTKKQKFFRGIASLAGPGSDFPKRGLRPPPPGFNILFISSLYPSEENSGAVTRALHNMVKYWNRYGNVIVVCPVYMYLKEIISGQSDSTVKKRLRKTIITIDDVTVIVYPIYKLPRIAYLYRPLYRFLDKYLESIDFKPDVVVAHYDKSLHIGYTYSQTRHLPFVAGLHITPDLMDNDHRAFTARCGHILKAAQAIACRSGYIYNKVCAWFPQYKEKSFIAFSGIDENQVTDLSSSILKMKQWRETGTVSLLTASSLIKRKKIDVILNALALLNKGGTDWHYTIIGDGEERNRLETLTDELGIRDRVTFLGTLPHDDVLTHMNRSHIFVLASEMETFGLVYLEAMAAGNVVIGSVGEGIDGVIENETNGFLVPSDDVESLKNILNKILTSYTESQLENILFQSHHTVTSYSERNAAMNYWNHLHIHINKEKHKPENNTNQKVLGGVGTLFQKGSDKT